MKKKKSVKQSAKQVEPAKNYPGRLLILLGTCVLWIYYHSCLEYTWILNTPSGITPSSQLYIHILPGEASTFSRNADKAFYADWLYFNNLRGQYFRNQERNHEKCFFFEKAEYFIKLNRELTDSECIEAQRNLASYRTFTQKKRKEHARTPYEVYCIGLLIAGVFFFVARKKYNFYVSLPAKHESWTCKNTNFLLFVLLLMQPVFVVDDLFLYDSSGKQIMRELCNLRAYLANPAYLKDTTQSKELFYAYLPYAYALGVHMQWALRCLYVYPEGLDVLRDKLQEINFVRERIRKIHATADKARKPRRRLFGIF